MKSNILRGQCIEYHCNRISFLGETNPTINVRQLCTISYSLLQIFKHLSSAFTKKRKQTTISHFMLLVSYLFEEPYHI